MAENLRQRGDRGSQHQSSYDDPNPDDHDHGGSHRRWSNLFRSKNHHVTAGYIFFLVVLSIILPLLYHTFKSVSKPYLCTRDERLAIHCPKASGTLYGTLLWQNPFYATTSWKHCADHGKNKPSSLHPENETTGYILIHAEGGLNQQRVAICNAVAVARLLNATLILPVLVQDLVWKDETKFEDVYDVGHFIDYLKDDVRIIREIPGWVVKNDVLYGSQRVTSMEPIVTVWDMCRIVRNIPKYASSQYYIDNVLPMIKTKKILSLKPFTDRLGYANVPQEINRLRCRVNYHALRFVPEVEKMADTLVSRMRMRTGRRIPFIALHLRYEKGMIGLSFCDFVGTREEKEMMDAYRKKLWPRRYNNGSHLWKLALEKRKSGKCPLEPGEIAMLLRALGYESNTQIYIASGPIYGGDNKLAPLRNMFPNMARKEELVAKGELDSLKKHVTNLAALDLLVCLKSDVFVSTHGGNFAKLIIGARRYMGHHLKSIKPAKSHMFRILGNPYMYWEQLRNETISAHTYLTGLPEDTFPIYDIWENPLTPCMCRTFN